MTTNNKKNNAKNDNALTIEAAKVALDTARANLKSVKKEAGGTATSPERKEALSLLSGERALLRSAMEHSARLKKEWREAQAKVKSCRVNVKNVKANADKLGGKKVEGKSGNVRAAKIAVLEAELVFHKAMLGM